MFEVIQKGDFKKTMDFLATPPSDKLKRKLDSWGKRGVKALSANTPEDTGETARSWYYETESGPHGFSIRWYNSVDINGTPLAIMLQYGHGTRQGGYVEGKDYINPSMRPVFDKIEREMWALLLRS